jgi:manganese efflux pump family protein
VLGAIFLFGVLAGLDNLQVCSSIGLLPIRRARKHLYALAFSACETLSPLAGLAIGAELLRLTNGAVAKAGPVMLLACGAAVVVLALRDDDVSAFVNGRGLLFGLPLSLSFDNLLAGVGLGAIHFPIVTSALVIGLVSAAMSCIGLYFGAAVRRFVPKRAEVIVGAYLCLLGVRMLFADAL